MKDSKLHNIKSAGFKTPKDYFESFDDMLLSKLNVENQLGDTKSTGFKVPEHYFENLEETLLQNINKNETKVVQLKTFKRVAYTTAIAASLVLMFSIFFKSKTITFDSLETAAIENYLIDGEHYPLDEMAALLTNEELSTEDFIETQISETSLENYLLNNVAIEDLIIE